MHRSGVVWTACSLVVMTACAGRTTTSFPTAPSSTPAAALATQVSQGAPRSILIKGTVGPRLGEEMPCFADRYRCETYAFSLAREGPIEVTMTWEGAPRAMLVQLYWAGEGLAHEDVAPRDGPSRIWFRRPLMEAAEYTIRVVSLEPESAIPFTLTLTR